MRTRWRLFRLRIHVRSTGWASWYGFWTAYWVTLTVWHLVRGDWLAVGVYPLFAAWQGYRLGQELGLITSRITSSGLVIVEHGPIYPGRAVVEDALAKGFGEALEADPAFSTRPEPDFAFDFGYTRARKPDDCALCDRPLERQDLRGKADHFEVLVCYGGRPSAAIRRHLPYASGHHYEWQMGPFRNAPKRRRRIRLALRLVLAPRPVGM